MWVQAVVCRCAETIQCWIIKDHAVREFATAEGNAKHAMGLKCSEIALTIPRMAKASNTAKRKEDSVIGFVTIEHLEQRSHMFQAGRILSIGGDR